MCLRRCRSYVVIFMKDKSAVYTLECTHRRQLLPVRALNERSLLIRGLPFLRAKTIGHVYNDDIVILDVLYFSDVHVDSLPNDQQRVDTLRDFLQMSTNTDKSDSTLTGVFWWGHLNDLSDTRRLPLTRRVSLMFISIQAAVVTVHRTLLKHLLRDWLFGLVFRRKVFVSLDMSYTTCLILTSSSGCRENAVPLDELVLVTGLAPLLNTNLRT